MTFDPVKLCFDAAVGYFGEHGVSERQARSVVGKWRRDHSDAAIIGAVIAAYKASAVDPVPYVAQVLAGAPRSPVADTGRFRPIESSDLPSEEPWKLRMENFQKSGFWWEEFWGPRPGEPGCRVPEEIK